MLKLACNFNVDVSAPNVDIKGGYGFDPGQCGSGSGAGIKSSTVVNAFDLIVFKITIGQWQILRPAASTPNRFPGAHWSRRATRVQTWDWFWSTMS